MGRKPNSEYLCTKQALCDTIKAHAKKYKEAPVSSPRVIDVGPLANGQRTWEHVCGWYGRDRIKDVSSDVSWSNFIRQENLADRECTQVYTYNKVRATIAAYVKEYKELPNHDSGIIDVGPLANMKRKWSAVYMAFRRNEVYGVPEGTTLGSFVKELGYTDSNNQMHEGRLDLPNIFNSVAWHIMRKKEIPQPSFDFIVHGALGPNKISFMKVSDLMISGSIKGIPKGMMLEQFGKIVEKRLQEKDFSVPSTSALSLAPAAMAA
jgi:hypothetical protein